ncbi:hypothetical protein Pint_26107 [Pistacia integerrima]|uniref:Uncharacterized protein n=1 Tax=Pistacia integerrima TaxID=434235 RepID=A0ACC0YCF0_9ROSI|nr:hypothetical protein Pint_26107 [Pistacia integerrima]
MTELAAAQTAIAGADFAIKQGTGIINSLKRKYGYVKDMTENYKKLLEEYRKLCLREEDIDIKLKRYEMEVDETEESKDWRGKVKRMIVEVEELKTQKAPDPHSSVPTNEIIEFPSVEENVNKLLEYLRKEDIKTTGIRGPIGVGKSSEGAERYTQQELQKQLNIPEERSDEQKKKMIHDNLKYKKYKQVCTGTNEEIEVKRLSDTDAQNMFWDRVGMDLKYNPHIKTQAELIIKFCSGMPYLIKLIGNYLSVMTREENVDCEAIWRSTCDLLTSPRGKPKGDLETVYKSLKFEIASWNQMTSLAFYIWQVFPLAMNFFMII